MKIYTKSIFTSLVAFAFLAMMGFTAVAKDYAISSPNGKINVSITIDDAIKWSASVDGQAIFSDNGMALELDDEILGINLNVKSAKKSSVSEMVTAIVPVKSRTIDNTYNQLELKFKNDYAIIFRVFDNGIAYRFETSKKGKVTVKNEKVDLNFAGDYSTLFPKEESIYSHYERLYLDEKIASLDSADFCSLPVLIKADNNIKVGITEADLYDFPCLFFNATGKASFTSKFSPIILESEYPDDRHPIVTKEADHIAITNGTRTYPWRVFMISEEDKELVENQMVFLLSRENKLEDTSWINPGLVAWDWWNDNNVYDVDFKAEINNQTYQYYIDFASKYGIPYVLLDEGWSKTTTNVLEPNPDIDVKELVEYGKTKGVDIILWSLWDAVDKDMDRVLDQFKNWGVKGIKVDFMARADQYMVNYYERLAKACADRYLLVNYHGAFKPSGLRKAYPNILNYEGVDGMEKCKWSERITPQHNVNICFTRMLAGPMDFTPGAMKNANKKDFFDSYSSPMSMGTRCLQLAMYVIYDAPMQMLSDSPSNYYREEECIQFLSKMKTVWDETKVLDAKVGEYIVTARRSEKDWYIGAMTNFDSRTLEVDLSFLGDGDYEIEIMQDGINVEKAAVDYTRIVKKVNRNSKVTIPMASGGGWAAICTKL